MTSGFTLPNVTPLINNASMKRGGPGSAAFEPPQRSPGETAERWPAGLASPRTQLPGAPGEPGPAMLTSQLTPNLSVHMPKVSPHGAGASGMVTVPPADSFSQ